MTYTDIAALITATAGLVSAIAQLVAAIRRRTRGIPHQEALNENLTQL